MQLAKQMHAVHNNVVSRAYFNFVDVKNVHHNSTRIATRCNFSQFVPRTEKGKRTISFAGPGVWREVPTDLKNLSIETFKAKYKYLLLNKY